MDRQLDAQCRVAHNFPLNVAGSEAPAQAHESRLKRLNDNESHLFCGHGEAALRFRELSEDSQAFWHTIVKDTSELQQHLYKYAKQERQDPWCRFLFIDAPHHRAKLNTTRAMLAFTLTYFQTMSDFLDFLFPFGLKMQAEDLHFSAFRQRTRISNQRRGLSIRDLGWSGRDFSLCYNLKSVESSRAMDVPQWSITQCAISHTFDVEFRRQNWIFLEAGGEIRGRITSATGERGVPEFQNYTSIDRAFAASLGIHLIVCDWSHENWRWYINGLEHDFQELSDRVDVDDVENFPMRRKPTYMGIYGATRTKLNYSRFSFGPKTPKQKNRRTTAQTTTSIDDLRNYIPLQHIDPISGDPLPPVMAPENIEVSPFSGVDSNNDHRQPDFTFRDLQTIYYIDGKLNEAALVIQHNVDILTQLREYYAFIFRSKSLPDDIKNLCEEDIEHFMLRIRGIENEFRVQKARLEALLRMVDDRRTLLHGTVDLRNTQSNMILAHDTQKSAFDMETVTHNMREIALKTKTETASMKIITLVTLFFLPSTFISTLMSTDVFQDKEKSNPGPNPFSVLSPLQFFMAASMSLTFITLLIWVGFHLYEKHKEHMSKRYIVVKPSTPEFELG